jgi:hypothetical protein
MPGDCASGVAFFISPGAVKFLSFGVIRISKVSSVIMSKILIILIAAIAVVAGCSHPGIRGDGEIKTEDRPISDFSKVVVKGGYEIKWSSGKPSLKLSADENLLPLIKTEVSGHTLQIDSKEEPAPTKSITIILCSASLADMQLSGGKSCKASHTHTWSVCSSNP